jgi:hypothetical protein
MAALQVRDMREVPEGERHIGRRGERFSDREALFAQRPCVV